MGNILEAVVFTPLRDNLMHCCFARGTRWIDGKPIINTFFMIKVETRAFESN
jgi:hypothetical protein